MTADTSSWPRSGDVFVRRGYNLCDLPIVNVTWRVRGLGVEIAMTPYR